MNRLGDKDQGPGKSGIVPLKGGFRTAQVSAKASAYASKNTSNNSSVARTVAATTAGLGSGPQGAGGMRGGELQKRHDQLGAALKQAKKPGWQPKDKKLVLDPNFTASLIMKKTKLNSLNSSSKLASFHSNHLSLQ